MQQPTLTNVRIRSTRDALQIFYAVARNVLPMTTRRLDAEERRAIASGCVYIWEERCANSEATGMGMERWTDGMGWGPSRVRDEFLFYHQRENDVHEDPNNPTARWASMMRRRDARGNMPFSRSDAERLIKQTYSVHVSLPEDRPRGLTRKWHLSTYTLRAAPGVPRSPRPVFPAAYFSQTTIDSLGTIDDIPSVGDVVVPEGWFKSARASKANKRLDPLPVEDVNPTAHEPWGITMTPTAPHAVPHYAVESPPKWTQPSPRISHSPHSLTGPYPVRSTTYPPVPTYESPRHPAHPLPPAPSQYPQGAPIPVPLPNLHDTGLHTYRDPSPYTQSSSSSSDPGLSPRPYSSPLTPPSNASLPLALKGESATPPQLVPLSYLQGLQRRRRDPMDELYLKRFSSPDLAQDAPHRHSWTGPGVTVGGGAGFDRFAEDEAKPAAALMQSARW
ncbi:Gti1/Pac2 family-domain-containing protein [Lenzites betulinus]|nr:Gti1/Pac2 family-domain-containing protein [Lenzites betulinus]